MIREVLSQSTWREIIGDFIGALSLFAIGYGSLWILPIIAEILK